MDDLAVLDGLGQAELVRTGKVSRKELVQSAIERIERLNPELNAVIIERFEKALDEAERVPAEAPFGGVPLLLKDAVCHSAGDPYHFGMRVLKEMGWVEREDSNLAKRFRAAGFVLLGKTNTPELAGSAVTEPLAYGPTLNPWRRDRSTLGSSGGSAAAVASGMVPIAHGNDMGGSIRMPAAACGLVGLKPSRGRTSLGPDFGDYMAFTTHEHVLTRGVRDSAAVLDAVAGYAPGDPYMAPPRAGTFLAASAAEPPRLRIGLLEVPADVVEAAKAAVAAAAKLLERLGHEVVPVNLPVIFEPQRSRILSGVAKAHDIAYLSRRTGRHIQLDELEPVTAMNVRRGLEAGAVDYELAVQARTGWARRVVETWRAQADILLLPTLRDNPPKIGECGPLSGPPEDVFACGAKYSLFTAAFNHTGEPAVSLPLGWDDEEGLPVGVQLVAGYGQDATLLSLAGQLERAGPWQAPYPATSTQTRPLRTSTG